MRLSLTKWFASAALLMLGLPAGSAQIQYCTTTPGIAPACLTITYPDVVCPAPVPCPTCPPPAPCPVCVACVPPPVVSVTTAGLTWNAVVAPNLAGYRVYYGTASGVYNQARGTGIPVAVTNYTVTGLTAGTWYFAVTAYDTLTNESPYSNEVSKVIAGTPPPGPVESPNLTKVTAAGVGSIIDSLGAVWSLGSKDPLVEGGVEYVVLRNGSRSFPPPQPTAAAQFMCYFNHTVVLSSTGSWYQWNGTFFQNIWPTVPAGC